jgi:hypothetical protein
MTHRMTGLGEIGLTPIIRLTCANVNCVGRGSVERIVGGKTALIKVGSTCFSIAFVDSLRRWF